MDNYICKIASIEEMNIKWDYEIEHAIHDKENWIIWKKSNIKEVQEGKVIPYYGILNGQIICEATAVVSKDVIQNVDRLVDKDTAYLKAFRVIKEYEAKGYFSKLYKYMEENLKSRGYKYLTLGVESEEKRNFEIYTYLGFTEYLKTDHETYPNGDEITVNYYRKTL